MSYSVQVYIRCLHVVPRAPMRMTRQRIMIWVHFECTAHNHLLYQFIPNATTREISLCLYVRSNDIGLGTPFNIAEGAALLHLVGRLTGYTPRWFTYFIGDAHIYENHMDMVQEQLKREPYEAPRLVIADRVPDFAATGKYQPEWLEKIEPADFSLEGYRHHPPLTAPMAV